MRAFTNLKRSGIRAGNTNGSESGVGHCNVIQFKISRVNLFFEPSSKS